jgi:hypothetical protein
VAQRKTLTEKQVELLRWIADGCPDGVMKDDFYRISAAALRNRSLITTSGRGPTWIAKITLSGTEYLAKVEAPNPPIPRQANVSVTQQLVDDVSASGGSLRLAQRPWGSTEGVDWEQRARLAQAHGKVPPGKRLSTRRIDGELELRLEDAIPGTNVPLQPVPVPKSVTRLHPVARRFREDTSKHLVSRAQLPRCTRIVHALAIESERRGFAVASVATTGDRRHPRRWKGDDGHLTISIRDHSYQLRIAEEKVVVRGTFDAETEYRRSVNYPAYLKPRARMRYDADATGRLQIACVGYSREGRPVSWADRRSWTLEDKLPDLLRELEVRAAEDDHAAIERKRQAEERERQWEAAMERAKRRLVEDHRIQVLVDRVRAWQEADAIRAYCDAVEARHGAEGVTDPEVVAWLAFARAQADRAQQPPHMPAEPEATPDALKPFLEWAHLDSGLPFRHRPRPPEPVRTPPPTDDAL